MIKCLLLDDDPAVLLYIGTFIENTPFLHLASTCTRPEEALAVLQSEEVQLVFTDIGLPGISGIDLARMLNTSAGPASPLIILISGFEHFALEGYKINAVDYLVKPVSYDDFLHAALKAKNLLEPAAYRYDDYLFLRAEYELLKVFLRDILYLESFKDYVNVYTVNSAGPVKALTTLKGIGEKLPTASFARIHRSFIVSLDKIESITKTSVRIGRATIPITPQYKENLKEFISQWF